MAKINPVSEPKVAGGFDTGLNNLSLINSTTPGGVPANTVKPNDGRVAMRVRGEGRTGAAPQRGGGNLPPTATTALKVKSGTPQNTGFVPPDRRINPATPSRPAAPEYWEGTAAAVMARANPIAEYMNASVKQFYREASGGVAARANHDMNASLRGISELRNQLSVLVRESAAFVTANRADNPALGKWHQGLVKSLGAIDSWLKSAHAYAAGLTGPGGNHTATPALVRPPSTVLSSSVSPRSATQEAAQIWQQYERANAVIKRT